MLNDEKQSSSPLTAGEVDSPPLAEQKAADGEQVRQLAYRFWQERGCPIDSAEEDWFRAERELASADGAGE